jgi:cyclic pyranopterin phosphate synthase
MVDVSDKPNQRRRARAEGHISLQPETVTLIRENGIAKGNVLTTAEIAGIQAAKKTGGLIPLCHPLVLDRAHLRLTLDESGVEARSEVVCIGRTGVEMEALTAVSVALLTVYDMCKAVDKTMCLERILLTEKVKEGL